MKVKVLFWNGARDNRSEFGPYHWVVATEQEIRVPVDLQVMDNDAQDFKAFSESILLPFDNPLAVCQKNGTLELRELAGRYAYEIYDHWQALEVK